MRFVVAVWNHIGNWRQFEAEIPLIFNSSRRADLGIREDVDLLFLGGYDLLEDEYRERLSSLGYNVHDVSDLSERYKSSLKNITNIYDAWRRIQYYGLIRFLIIEDFFKGERVITFDSDIVPNATFEELAEFCSDRTFQNAGSSCFISISDDAWFADYRRNLFAFNSDPRAYVSRYCDYSDPDIYLDPMKAGGTDQAFLGNLARHGMIRDDAMPFYSDDSSLVMFPNWLHIGIANRNKKWKYKRLDGIDYLNDKKVAVSHMSNDTCCHFGFHIFLRHILGIDADLRLPVPYFGMEDNHADPRLLHMYSFLRSMLEGRRSLVDTPKDIQRDPFLRANVLEYFYGICDFSSIMNGSSWWQPEVFD